MAATKVPVFGITVTLILFILCTGVWSSRCTWSSMEVITGYRGTVQLERQSFVEATCRFRAKCDDVEVAIYRSDDRNNDDSHTVTRPLTDYYWYAKGLRYQYKCTHREGDDDWTYYECNMNIASFNYGYASRYFCVIKNNESNSIYKEEQIFFLTLRSFVNPTTPTCFVPSAQNISVQSTTYSNGSVGVILTWNESVKESNIEYCHGSRDWKVLVQSFSRVSLTPPDGSKKVYNGNWVNVTGLSTQYTFSQLLNNTSYYQFLVGNQADTIAKRTFGSYIYYFGRQNAPVIIQPQQVHNLVLSLTETYSLPCTATGFPSPNVQWISDSTKRVEQTGGVRSSTLQLNSVTMDHKGTYICIASNLVVNPPDGRKENNRIWRVNVDIKGYNATKIGVTCHSNLQLEDYFCKDYIHPQFSIYSNLSVPKSSLKEKVGTAMTSIYEHIKDVQCQKFAKSLLCHTVYPYCDVHQSTLPTPRSICNAACTEFTNKKCKIYANALKTNVPNLYQLLMSKCENSRGGQAPECIPISYDSSKNGETRSILDTGSCMKGNGIGYSGKKVYTKSHHLCQLWTVQYPHKHPMIPAIYAPELQGAGNACRNPGGLGSKPWCYTTNTSIRWEYCDIPLCDTCEAYNGTMCSKISGYDTGKVFIRRGPTINSWLDIERRLSQIFLSTRFHQRPSEGCQQLLELLLCRRVFPLCHENQPTGDCTNNCKVLRSVKQFCPRVYREYMSFVSINDNLGFLSELNCSNCIHNISNTIQVLSNQTHPANNTYSCYNDDGRFYQGNISQTINGINCLNWTQSHTLFITDSSHYMELHNASNYCRNPGGLLERPWCLTNTPKGWDYCLIDFCFPGPNKVPHDVPIKDGISTNGGEKSTVVTPLGYTFLFALIIFFIAIIVASVAIVLIRKRKQKLKNQSSHESPEKSNVMNDQSFVVNSTYFPTTTVNSIRQIPDSFRMLESSQIKYISQLGQGNFGIVFKGQAFNILSDDEETEVAVKSLKEESSSEVVSNFIDEAKLMFTFDHPNILRIYGVCMSEMPYQMVLEYMDGGDLTQFLRARASSTQRRIVNPFIYRSRTESSYSNDPPSLNKTQLLSICKQIADGMKYLASQNHVHRDLACRNCLVKSDLTVKIGDFGMSRNLYSRDYYRVKGQAILPVRWMPPEALVYGTFSVEGDVWSFGVVMWEVFSFALQPYYGRTNEEVTEAIRHGKILNHPDDCPNETYSLMKECWNMEPKSRPTFQELYSELCYLYKSSETDRKSESSDDLSYNSDDSDAFLSDENSLPEGIVLS